MYYLQTRYYDPETGRFISMDSIEYLDPESIHGLNLYAYCANNPVMCIDPSGKAFITALVLGILFGAAIGGTLNGISAYNDGQRGWGLLGSIVGGAIMGGAMGAIMVIGGTAGLTSLGIGFTEISLTFNTALGFSLALGLSAGFASYSVENLLRTDREWTITGFLASGASGVVKAAATFGIAYLGGRAGAFDKMVLKPLIKGAETISKGVTHGIAKSMMAELTHIFSRQLLTPFSIIFGDTTTKLLFVSLPAATVRYVIDFIFGT